MRDFIRTITAPELKPVTEAVEASRECIGQRIQELEKASQKIRGAIQEELCKLKNSTDDAFQRNESFQHAFAGKIDKLSAETIQCIESSQLRLRETSEETTAKINEILISYKEESINAIKDHSVILIEHYEAGKSDILSKIISSNNELRSHIADSLLDLSVNQKTFITATQAVLKSKILLASGILALLQAIFTAGLFFLFRHSFAEVIGGAL